MPHRYFQLLVKIQRENGVQLVEAHKNNKAGKFKSFKIIYPKLLLFSGTNLQICWMNLYVYSRSSHWRCSIKKRCS